MPPNQLVKPASAVLPKPPRNPFTGLGVEGSALPGQPAPYSTAPPAPYAPAAPTPPPVDFSSLVGTDPQYIREQALNQNQNQLSMQHLLNSFRQNAQSSQDSFNAHGGLFSGAAVNAQRYAGQQFADASAQQAQNANTAGSNSLSSAWQRILQQYAGGGA